jgi:serine/threonine protein phosphatase PrpC
MTGTLSLIWAADSVTGLGREDNEDSVYAGRRLFAVADGMGGHAAGEVASAAVIGSLRAQDREVAPDALLEVLGRAVAEANAEVARRAAEDPARLGMGTTLTAMFWSGDRVAVGHIGDSRGFRLRDGQLLQITEDHVLERLVFDAGSLLGPVLSRFLDGSPRSPDLVVRELRPGDRYLLCSDGLSPVVAVAAIRDVLVVAADPAEAVRRLVGLAEDAGGPDNISVIVIDVHRAGGGEQTSEPVIAGAAAAYPVASG